MLLVILLAISIISQFFAAFVAIRLTRTTKYNSAWILITIALILTCVLMMSQFMKVLDRHIENSISIELHENVSIWISVAISLCFAVGVFLIKKVMTYIADREEHRRKSEERILNAVIKAEEAQRNVFAKELHDGLGPLLSTAKLSISALAARCSNEMDKEIITNAEQAITLSIKSAKDISNNLSPHILNNFGVVRALNSFINRLRPVVDTKIVFETNLKAERFSTDHEIVAFRVTCELINNAIKHAEASVLTVILRYHSGVLTIEVRDNGNGFDVEELTEGMGLSNISSRVSSSKGKMDILSNERTGTKVLITLPMATVTPT